MQFPLPFVPKQSYKHGNGFGGSREKVRAGLMHAANDLRAPSGTPVLALEDGYVLAGPYEFFRTTYAIEIQHKSFIARYCEISKNTEVTKDDEVREGQIIGYVGNQPGNDMLHIEFYSGDAVGPLTVKPNPPYDRRSDVFDGASYLDEAARDAALKSAPSNYAIITDDEGKKFFNL